SKPHLRSLRVLRSSTPSFFFSSRRRHTRSLRDWSSDVCSSDLYHPDAQNEADRAVVNAWIRAPGNFDGVIDLDAALRDPATPNRSEERRVGKEGRERGGPEQ